MVNIDRGSNQKPYDIKDLLEIVRVLRGPGGCPWDREQTHASIRNAILEEAYEAADAIDRNDPVDLCEELGDVLLQVVFHCQMSREQDGFDFDRVADGICRKLIYRHPHVFGDVQVSGSEQVLTNWDALKKAEKGQKTDADALRSVPRSFPALMRAEKVQKRASKAGFDWDDISDVLAKLREELAELEDAVASGDADAAAGELGDLLFSAVNAARFLHTDSEQALSRTTDIFIRRFALTEELAARQGIDLKTAGLQQLDKLWDEAKAILSRQETKPE